MPSKKELDRVRAKLENVEAVRILPDDASNVDKLKYSLCKIFVTYLRTSKMTQVDLAKMLDVDPARISEIIKYKIELFTVDRLLTLAEKFNPKLRIKIAS